MTPDQAPTAPLKTVRRCGHWLNDNRCETADSTVRSYLVGQRCSEHTPSAVTGRPESLPDPTRTIHGLRAANRSDVVIDMPGVGRTVIR